MSYFQLYSFIKIEDVVFTGYFFFFFFFFFFTINNILNILTFKN